MRRLALVAVVLAGCGASVAHHARGRPASPIVLAQARHEYPSPSPARQHAAGTFGSPVAAVAGFASAYINWSASTVAADMSELGKRSVGQARAAVQLAAAETAGDYELHRDGIANSGTVEAVAPLTGHPDEYVVVTREQTTAAGTTAYQGLRPAWHVTIATVSEIETGRWVLSGWEPQS